MLRSEEHKLIREAARGDQEAAASIIRHHQQSLYAYMLRMSGRPDVAEDIVQEAFVRVLTNLDRFDFRYRFSTWLFTIARRLYLNAIAKHRPAYDTDMVGSWKSSAASPEAPVEADEQQEARRDTLQAALLTLPPDQREVVILFHQHDWPIALIARHLDMPEGTVKSHLHRGRKRLRTHIEVAPSSGDALAESLA